MAAKKKSKPKGKYKNLKASQFGLAAQRKYPLNTKKRARNAIARASQHATAAQKAQIRRRVKAKYPSIKQSTGSKKRKRRR